MGRTSTSWVASAGYLSTLPMIFPIYEIDVGFSGFDLQLT
jgi:hypothetical protein